MKVLLIYPPYRHGRFVLPKGLAYVAACLLKAGHEVKVLDADAFVFTDEQLKQRLLDEEYDVVGISALATAYNFVLKVAHFIKRIKPSVSIIVGGHLATHSYEILLRNSSVDFCVIGEGEVTAVDLLAALSGEKSLKDVNGIAYKENGFVIKTKPREFIENLDEIPFPAWDLFSAEEVYSRNTYTTNIFKAGRHLFINGSRGCPYSCTFCSYQKKVRLRSPASIIEELKYMKQKYGIRNFSFEDELFMVKKERTEEFCNRLIEEKLDLYWWASGRVNLVDKDILSLAKRAGCIRMSYGIESGSPEVLKRMKKNITPEGVEKAIRMTHEAGIQPGGTWILGMPGENEETIRMSVALYKKINKYRNGCNEFFFATAYPGTVLYRQMQEKGRITDEHEYMKKLSQSGDAFNFVVNCTDAFSDVQLAEMKKRIDKEVKKDFYRKHPFLWIYKVLNLNIITRVIIFIKINGFAYCLDKVKMRLMPKKT